MSPPAPLPKNENPSFCKPNNDRDIIHAFLKLDSQKDLNDFNTTEVCNKGLEQLKSLGSVCPGNQLDACTKDPSCLLQVFNDDNHGKTSACFCPSPGEESTVSACQAEFPYLFSTATGQTNETSPSPVSASSTISSAVTSSSPSNDDTNSSSTESVTGDSGSPSGGSSLPASKSPKPTNDGVPDKFSSASSLSATPTAPSTHYSASNHKLSVPIIVGAILGGLVFLLLLIGAFLYFRRRKRRSHVPPSAEFLERGYGTRTPQPALFDAQRDSAAELLPDYDRGTAANPPFEKESELVVASPEGYGIGHGLSKRQ